MNTRCPNPTSGRLLSSAAEAQRASALPAALQPVSNTPAELGLGEVAFVIDEAGVIIAAEPLCTALFQWEPAELIDQLLELVLVAGTDKIRQHLVPGQDPHGPDGEGKPRLFALAQRKDGSSFPVAVTLELQAPHAGCWWAVAFHDVNSPPVAPSESRPVDSLPPAATPRRGRLPAAGALAPEVIPDVFQRAPAAPGSQSGSPAPSATVASEPPGLPPRIELSPEPVASALPPALPVPANGDARVQELEQQLSQSAADLKRTRAHLQQQDEQLHAANTATQQAAAALETETARRTQLEAELAQTRQADDELNTRLSAEQQARAEAEARLHELEQRLAQSQPPPAPAPAPMPSEGDPALQEQLLELESRLRTTVNSLARTTAELETERGERRRSEQRAATLAARMQQLHEELKEHLAIEQSDRERLAQLEQQLHEQTQQNDLAVAKLQSALQLEQCERKRLEAELLRSRVSDSPRAGRAQVNGLRRQLQPPVESLHQSTRRLLQLQLSEDQRQLVQAMLEDTLLLHTSLQESPEG